MVITHGLITVLAVKFSNPLTELKGTHSLRPKS